MHLQQSTNVTHLYACSGSRNRRWTAGGARMGGSCSQPRVDTGWASSTIRPQHKYCCAGSHAPRLLCPAPQQTSERSAAQSRALVPYTTVACTVNTRCTGCSCVIIDDAATSTVVGKQRGPSDASMSVSAHQSGAYDCNRWPSSLMPFKVVSIRGGVPGGTGQSATESASITIDRNCLPDSTAALNSRADTGWPMSCIEPGCVLSVLQCKIELRSMHSPQAAAPGSKQLLLMPSPHLLEGRHPQNAEINVC